MATENPSVLPAIFAGLDEVLASEAALFIQGELDSSTSAAYGKSLSFDWSTLRFRTDAAGQLIVVSGQEALLEDVVKTLMTTRYEVPIYDDDYGCELNALIGLPYSIVKVQIEEMVKEALLVDDRISHVEVEVRVLSGAPKDHAHVTVSVRDFNDLLLDVPEVLIRYG